MTIFSHFITILANDPNVNQAEAMAASRHTSAEVHAGYIKRTSTSENNRVNALINFVPKQQQTSVKQKQQDESFPFKNVNVVVGGKQVLESPNGHFPQKPSSLKPSQSFPEKSSSPKPVEFPEKSSSPKPVENPHKQLYLSQRHNSSDSMSSTSSKNSANLQGNSIAKMTHYDINRVRREQQDILQSYSCSRNISEAHNTVEKPPHKPRTPPTEPTTYSDSSCEKIVLDGNSKNRGFSVHTQAEFDDLQSGITRVEKQHAMMQRSMARNPVFANHQRHIPSHHYGPPSYYKSDIFNHHRSHFHHQFHQFQPNNFNINKDINHIMQPFPAPQPRKLSSREYYLNKQRMKLEEMERRNSAFADMEKDIKVKLENNPYKDSPNEKDEMYVDYLGHELDEEYSMKLKALEMEYANKKKRLSDSGNIGGFGKYK